MNLPKRGSQMSMQTLNTDRLPVVAGSFYPADKETLTKELQSDFDNAKEFPKKEINAIIVPHAGYVFSAQVAATAYKTLHKNYKNIFILGSSHHINFNGISIYDAGDYITPLGKVKVNKSIVTKLIKDNDFITYKKEAHTKEHTIEVQLPFLQTLYGDSLQIVPILMATSELNTIQATAKVLLPYFTSENLFVISSDLSHYPNYDDAKVVDGRLLDALTTNSTQNLVEAIIKNENSKTVNLQTSACGWSSLLTLLYLTQSRPYTYELLEYKNSGDTKYGDHDRVVGYGALRVYKEDVVLLDDKEKKELKEIAKLALYESVLHDKRLEVDATKLPHIFKEDLGAFVTLKKDGQLRGCIGRFEPHEALFKVIIEMTIAASRHDARFTPVTQDELENIEIEISVLTPRKKIDSLQDIVIGKHGIYIQYGSKSGTYLPQVATDMHWSVEEFVKSCCQEKAGIDANDCKNANIYTYEAIVF